MSDTLFQWIERHEASTPGPWGRVLDAGTGRHSLQWLTALDAITELVAVTGESSLAEELTEEFGEKGTGSAPPLRVVAGNWVDGAFLREETARGFDVIIADYLVGSIEGFAPYFQDAIFARLKRLLAPNGRLYVVGLEPLTETPSCGCCQDDPSDATLVRDMARIRDACILLAGRRCYREFPLAWSERALATSGLEVRDKVQMTNVYTLATIRRQLQVARNQLQWFADQRLAESMALALDAFDGRVVERLGVKHQQQQPRKIRFGFDYVIAAAAAQ